MKGLLFQGVILRFQVLICVFRVGVTVSLPSGRVIYTWLTWCQVGTPKGSRCWLTQSTLQVFVVQSCHLVFLYPYHPWEQHCSKVKESEYYAVKFIGGEVCINKIQYVLRMWSWTFSSRMEWYSLVFHRENGGTLGMVPLIINPIYTLYSGYLLGIPPSKGLLGGA